MIKHLLFFSVPFILFCCAIGKNKPDESQSQLSGLYEKALMNSYTYMFDDQVKIELEGQQFGMFKGGVKGMLLYSGMKEGVNELLGGNSGNNFYDITPYIKYSGGINLFENKSTSYACFGFMYEGVHSFNHVNPTFVNWAKENLIPDPKEKIGEHTFQAVYDAIGSRFFRLMTDSYLYVQRQNLEEELFQYTVNFNNRSFNGLRYLQNKYADVLSDYREENEQSKFTPGIAIGFWLRRTIDGTSDEFWDGLTTVMEQYDKTWFQERLNFR